MSVELYFICVAVVWVLLTAAAVVWAEHEYGCVTADDWLTAGLLCIIVSLFWPLLVVPLVGAGPVYLLYRLLKWAFIK